MYFDALNICICERFYFKISSLSGEPEHVDDNIVVFKRVLFAEVAIIFGVPEARGTHVKSAVTFL